MCRLQDAVRCGLPCRRSDWSVAATKRTNKCAASEKCASGAAIAVAPCPISVGPWQVGRRSEGDRGGLRTAPSKHDLGAAKRERVWANTAWLKPRHAVAADAAGSLGAPDPKSVVSVPGRTGA